MNIMYEIRWFLIGCQPFIMVKISLEVIQTIVEDVVIVCSVEVVVHTNQNDIYLSIGIDKCPGRWVQLGWCLVELLVWMVPHWPITIFHSRSLHIVPEGQIALACTSYLKARLPLACTSYLKARLALEERKNGNVRQRKGKECKHFTGCCSCSERHI